MRALLVLAVLYAIALPGAVRAQDVKLPTPDQFCVGRVADDMALNIRLLAKVQELQAQIDKRKAEDDAAAKEKPTP